MRYAYKDFTLMPLRISPFVGFLPAPGLPATGPRARTTARRMTYAISQNAASKETQ
ncbi:MAG: hypothetical protein JWQ50_9522 [Caballeronia mineralivorans]|nr:hypothetical protein [Caballeronia mineralivorans]